MSFIIFIILITLNLILIFLKKYQKALATSFILALLIFSIALGFLPSFLLNNLQKYSYLNKPDWKQKNVIIFLAGGSVKWKNSEHLSSRYHVYARLYESSRLYFDCKLKSKNCQILVSGGDPGNIGTAEATIIMRELSSIGIPTQDIITETESRNTYENARFSKPLLEKFGFDNIVLVTSATHMKRSQEAFEHFKIKIIPAVADHLVVHTSWKNLYQNFYYTDVALHEYVGSIKMNMLSHFETH